MRGLLLGPVLCAVLLAGCGGDDGGGSGDGRPRLSRAEVEKGIGEQLAEQVGRAPETVSCPDDLPGVEGRRMRCSITDAGTELGATVTVTAVDGDDVRFRVQLADAPS